MNILPTIDVPTYTLTIPTTKQNIKYRPYLVKEEKILLIALETEDSDQIEEAIINIVQICVGNTIDVKGLSLADLEYMFLKIRSVSVGEKAKVINICQGETCIEEATLTIDLNKLDVHVPESDNLRFDLGKGLIIDMRYPSVADRELLKGSDDDDIIVATVAVCIKTIFYGEEIYDMNTVPFNERVEFLGNLNVPQFAPLMESLFNQPSVNYKTKWKCNKCGNMNDVEYNGLIDFFI